MSFRELPEKEMVRRIIIGLNDQLSLEQRKAYVKTLVPVQWLLSNVKNFRNYGREAYATLRWLRAGENRTLLEYGEKYFPSFEGLTSRLPYLLFIEGVVPEHQPKLAIVGTRRPNYQALQEAFKLGFEASLNGLSCVSGMAEGVDQAGMRGCLSASEVTRLPSASSSNTRSSSASPCLGVLACGHNLEYPAFTSRLRQEIIEQGGAIISRFAPDTPSYKSNFVSRNMIIAAYSSAVVAVQAPRHSGTLITSDYAISMNKDVYVGSAGLGEEPCSEGTKALAYEGAPVVRGLEDFDELATFRAKATPATGYDAENSKDKVRFGDKWYIVERILR